MIVTFEDRCKKIVDEKIFALDKDKMVAETAFQLYKIKLPDGSIRRLNYFLSEHRKNKTGPTFKENLYSISKSNRYRYKYDSKVVFQWLSDNDIKYWPEIKKDWLPDPVKYPYRETLESERVKKSLEKIRLLELEIKAQKARNQELRDIINNPTVTEDAAGLTNEGIILSRAKPIRSIRGIYFLINDNQIVYVGKSENIKQRVATHLAGKEFSFYSYIEIKDGDLDVTERAYIYKFSPKYNGNGFSQNSPFRTKRGH